MKKKIVRFLLCLTAAFSLAATSFAASQEDAGSSTITVSASSLEPGYYLCAVWDGEELLRLFDYTVGSDGKMETTIEVGKRLDQNDSVKVGISGANANTEPIVLYIKPDAAVIPDTPTYPTYPDKPSRPNPGTPSTTPSEPEQPVPETPAPPEEPAAFTDVPEGAYYYDAVLWAAAQGVTAGTTATTFGPEEPCTRAQAVTFLWQASGSPAPQGGGNPFADVAEGAYYYDAVRWAVEQGITAGTSASAFSPDETVTRGQAMTFLYRAAGSPAVSGGNPFTDVDGGAYYAAAVQWAVAQSITSGTSAAAFSPDEPCTRAHIVTFLYRAR